MEFYENFLILVSSAMFLAAIYFSYKLSKETTGEKYWLFFLIAAIAMGVYHTFRHPELTGFVADSTRILIVEVMEIVGAFSFAYACFGLYKSMKRVREKFAEELKD